MAVPTRDLMGGLAKGLAVIETFGFDRPRLSISEAAERSGLDRATARRCLLTLAHHGYADWDGKFFTLTPRVLRLGTASLASMPLPQIVQPVLDALSDRIGESSSVSILDGPEIVYIARASQRKVMSISLMPGSRLPAYCTSMGRILLAALAETERLAILGPGPLPRRTAATQTSLTDVLTAIERAGSDGFAVIDQEVEAGLVSIAVALRDMRGRVVAALNIGLSSGTCPAGDLAARYLPDLQAAAAELRQVLR